MNNYESFISETLKELDLQWNIDEIEFRKFLNDLKEKNLKKLGLTLQRDFSNLIHNYLLTSSNLIELQIYFEFDKEIKKCCSTIFKGFQNNKNLKSFSIHGMFKEKDIDELFSNNYSLQTLNLKNNEFSKKIEFYEKRNKKIELTGKMKVFNLKKDTFFTFQ